MVRSIECIKYGFEDRHRGQHKVLEKRAKYWSMAFLAALKRTFPMIYLAYNQERCIHFR